MKVAVLVVTALLLFMLWPQTATTQTTPKPEQLAQKSAEAWLALIDSGKYAESWDEASQSFKNAVTKDNWLEMLKPVRPPLGNLQSRKLSSAEHTTTLPGAPDGQYVVMKFGTSFEHKKSAVETVVCQLDKDGKWRVSSYLIA